MATWKSIRSVKFDRDMGMDYAKCEQTWEYGTVSDCLIIFTEQGEYNDYEGHHAKKDIRSYQKEEALAMLETLLDWTIKYEGRNAVASILKRVRS